MDNNLSDKEIAVLTSLLNLANPYVSNSLTPYTQAYQEALTRPSEQQKIKDLLSQGYASRIASGEGDTDEALGYLESLTQSGDTSPITSLRNAMTNGKQNKYEINAPDDMKDTAVANKYQEIYNKAVQGGDYSQLDEFKSQYPEYNFNVDEEGKVEANKRDWSLASKFATLFGGEEEGRKNQTKEDIQNAINEFYGSKYGLLGSGYANSETSQGYPTLNTDEGKAFLKKKGVTKKLVDSLGNNAGAYRSLNL